MNLAMLDVKFEQLNSCDDSFSPDPIGYFIVRATKKGLRLEHYTNDDYPAAVFTVGGNIAIDKQAETLRKYVLANYPRIEIGHYGYLCGELAKAECSLIWEHDYTQS